MGIQKSKWSEFNVKLSYLYCISDSGSLLHILAVIIDNSIKLQATSKKFGHLRSFLQLFANDSNAF